MSSRDNVKTSLGLEKYPNIDDHDLKNKTEAMLDDADATHKMKPVENYFGNFDWELEKTGPQVSEKVTSDLVIKYSKDIIEDGHMWRMKANRKIAVELNAQVS